MESGILSQVSMLTPNSSELLSLLTPELMEPDLPAPLLSSPHAGLISAVVRALPLLKQNTCKVVLCTLGERGVLYCEHNADKLQVGALLLRKVIMTKLLYFYNLDFD